MCASTVTLLLKPKVRDGQRGTGPARCRELPSGSPSTEPGVRTSLPGAWAPPIPGLPSDRAAASRLGSGTPRLPCPCFWIPRRPLHPPPMRFPPRPGGGTLAHSSWFCICSHQPFLLHVSLALYPPTRLVTAALEFGNPFHPEPLNTLAWSPLMPHFAPASTPPHHSDHVPDPSSFSAPLDTGPGSPQPPNGSPVSPAPNTAQQGQLRLCERKEDWPVRVRNQSAVMGDGGGLGHCSHPGPGCGPVRLCPPDVDRALLCSFHWLLPQGRQERHHNPLLPSW